MTKSPKVLPWIARKTGISDARAEALWRKAVSHAACRTGGAGNADYYRAAMECLHELAMREKTVGA